MIIEEFNKIKNLYHSIKTNGFKYFSRNGVLGGYFLHSKNGKKVFIVTQGNHRLSVLSYLDYKNILVYTMKGYLENVYEKDVHNWPFVRNGKITVDDALIIFNLYFKNENY